MNIVLYFNDHVAVYETLMTMFTVKSLTHYKITLLLYLGLYASVRLLEECLSICIGNK
jgi:hypothetical protein